MKFNTVNLHNHFLVLPFFSHAHTMHLLQSLIYALTYLGIYSAYLCFTRFSIILQNLEFRDAKKIYVSYIIGCNSKQDSVQFKLICMSLFSVLQGTPNYYNPGMSPPQASWLCGIFKSISLDSFQISVTHCVKSIVNSFIPYFIRVQTEAIKK